MNLKKVLAFLLMSALLLSIMLIPAMAESNDSFELKAQEVVHSDDGTTTVYFTDGSRLYISAVEKNSALYETASTTPEYHRTASYTSSDGVLQWEYTLYGTFSYVYGKSSTCIDASYTQTIYESDWTFSDGAAIKSGNTAIGNGNFKLKFFFVTVQTYEIDISLTCDVYGNVT